MDEQNLAAAPIESTLPSIAYKDRSTGLIVFGILTILLGCVCALFLPLMLFGQTASAKATGTPPNFSAILPGMSIYGVLAVALVWLGIGSIKARRWARALLLIFSWSWLLMGIVMLVVMAFLLPKMLANMPASGANAGHPAVSSSVMTMIMIFTMGFFAVFFVIVPGIFTFFYRSRHVKATCEARDPAGCWTDACPLPVLACSLWLIVCAPMMLIMPLTGHVVMPFFGVFLTGASGAMLCLAVAAVWGYGAWAIYKLNRRGWWLIFILMCVYMVSNLLTFARHDVMEMYRLMGYPDAQIQQLQKSSFLTGSGMMWLMALCMLPWLGYLIYIEKFFRSKPQVPANQ